MVGVTSREDKALPFVLVVYYSQGSPRNAICRNKYAAATNLVSLPYTDDANMAYQPLPVKQAFVRQHET